VTAQATASGPASQQASKPAAKPAWLAGKCHIASDTPFHWESPADIHAHRPIVCKADGANYRALVETARAILVLQNWASDLTVHDRAALRGVPASRRFLWSLGKNGTHLVWLDPPEGETWDPRRERYTRASARSWVHAITESRPHLYLWDGVSLSSCDADRAVALLLESTT
jgi:hypothetical protein